MPNLLNFVVLVLAGVALTTPAEADRPMTLTIETAYAVEISGDQRHVDVFIVINNKTGREVLLTSVQSPVAGSAQFHRGSEKPFDRSPAIPDHAELYMLPGGVHVSMTNVGALGKVVPLELEIDGKTRVRIDADVVAGTDQIPDHHSFQH